MGSEKPAEEIEDFEIDWKINKSIYKQIISI